MIYLEHRLWHLLPLLALLALGLQVDAQPLQPFKAEYDLYRGDSRVGRTQFNLAKADGNWTWYTQTRPVGIYRALTSNQPFEETQLQATAQDLQLLQHRKGKHPQQPAGEESYFDHAQGLIIFRNERNNRRLQLPAEVYNYHSIHLLYPQMDADNRSQRDIIFYKSGKLVNSQVRLDRHHQLVQDQDTLIVDRLTQSFADSAKQMIYYYQPGSLAPVKIEQLKPGKPDNVMWRISYQ
ncbi:MAG: hypothetical protein QNJ69_04010 [Gammaproteobacteria bacterium]|nr:hypothetical protein [Gammaproteobacteria bacterium]